MKRLLALGFLTSLAALTAVAQGSHFDDPARQLPSDPAWTKAAEGKLDAFERATGTKILVRIILKAPTAEEDKVPGAYMSALARKLGTLQTGVLVVYFPSDEDWRVWIGDELAPRFAGKPGTVRELTESGAIHEVKEAMVAAARAKGHKAYKELRKNGDHTKFQLDMDLGLQVDALLDALIDKLSPKGK